MQQKVLLVLGGMALPLLIPLIQVPRPSNLYKLWQPAIRDDVIIRYFSQNHGVSVPFPGCVHNSDVFGLLRVTRGNTQADPEDAKL